MFARAAFLALLALAGFAAPAVAQSRPGPGAALIEKARALFDAEAALRRRDGSTALRAVPRESAGEEERARRDARDLLRQAAERGDATGRRLYAQMLETGVGGEARPAEARALYAELRRGDPEIRIARWRLGRMLEMGWGGPKDLVSARKLYKLASDAGQIDARVDYARMLAAGRGGKADAAAARALLQGVDTFCHADAADELARMAERGEGGPRDVETAARFYLRAVECRNEVFRAPAALAGWGGLDLRTRIAIQRRLAEDGRYDGPRDGVWRAALRKAIGAGA